MRESLKNRARISITAITLSLSLICLEPGYTLSQDIAAAPPTPQELQQSKSPAAPPSSSPAPQTEPVPTTQPAGGVPEIPKEFQPGNDFPLSANAGDEKEEKNKDTEKQEKRAADEVVEKSVDATKALTVISQELKKKNIVMLGDDHTKNDHGDYFIEAIKFAVAQKTDFVVALEFPSYLTEAANSKDPGEVLKLYLEYFDKVKLEKEAVPLHQSFLRALLPWVQEKKILVVFVDADLRKTKFEDRDKWMAVQLAEIRQKDPNKGILMMVGAWHLGALPPILKKDHKIENVVRIRMEVDQPLTKEELRVTDYLITDIEQMLNAYTEKQVKELLTAGLSFLLEKRLTTLEKIGIARGTGVFKFWFVRVGGQPALVFDLYDEDPEEKPLPKITSRIVVYFDSKGKVTAETVSHKQFFLPTLIGGLPVSEDWPWPPKIVGYLYRPGEIRRREVGTKVELGANLTLKGIDLEIIIWDQIKK